jgi:hypothetical protein
VKPGDVVHWKGAGTAEFGVVMDVARLGTVTVRTALIGGVGGGRELRFKKRLREGYERYLRPATAAELKRIAAGGGLGRINEDLRP